MQYDLSSTFASDRSPKLRRSSDASLPTAASPPGTFCIPGGQLNSFTVAAAKPAAAVAVAYFGDLLTIISPSPMPLIAPEGGWFGCTGGPLGARDATATGGAGTAGAGAGAGGCAEIVCAGNVAVASAFASAARLALATASASSRLRLRSLSAFSTRSFTDWMRSRMLCFDAGAESRFDGTTALASGSAGFAGSAFATSALAGSFGASALGGSARAAASAAGA